MREIEFRGKNEYDKQWTYGYYSNNKCGNAFIIVVENDGRIIYDSEDVDVDTVGQYTGRKDINNIKIYEGDIVENEDYIGAVAYSEELAHYGIVYKDMKGRTFMICLCDFDNPKVIGNIHDNPELLEV